MLMPQSGNEEREELKIQTRIGKSRKTDGGRYDYQTTLLLSERTD